MGFITNNAMVIIVVISFLCGLKSYHNSRKKLRPRLESVLCGGLWCGFIYISLILIWSMVSCTSKLIIYSAIMLK